ncbi:aminomethyltransferase [Acinetobacter sp. ANC 4558]|uniref:aminomethyltransferase family protein n=1 Tax=Acinetobacter sp. ANC 4558 TaxID=1977876 RepID=UPI000A348345|nr:aminomethyltransferase family protein [Acinetobacter sp. ANC 4558]OTG86202.1 aminomethyltransferase [Acinetobacter sp. ANC 4558]
MGILNNIHMKNNAKMGVFNGKELPALYHDAEAVYKAVRENAILVDHSHMSILSVMGEDAWSLINYLSSADISIIRDEQGMYTLILNEDGTIFGDAYILCSEDGYYILSESLSTTDLIERLNLILAEQSENLDIQEIPEINSMDTENWGAILLEGPYSWELLSEIYGFDIIGLPYHEYMNTDDGLLTFRCGKHGEFAYLMVGEKQELAELWEKLLQKGERYQLKVAGLDYQNILRIENPCWDASIYHDYTRNPVVVQMQWAIGYDKEDFMGKSAVDEISNAGVDRKLLGIKPLAECHGITANDKVLINGEEVGIIVKGAYSPANQSFIALALIDKDYAWSDIEGFDIQTSHGDVAAKTHNLPFLYNFSMLVNPTEHSYVDVAKPKSAL